MKRNKQIYQSENAPFKDRLNFKYEIGSKIKQKTNLDNWLTERYALFQEDGDKMYEFEIHHPKWEVYNSTITDLKLSYPRFIKYINNTPDKIQYSPGVQVVAWNKVLI